MNLRIIKGSVLIALGGAVAISGISSGIDATHIGLSKFTPEGRDGAQQLVLLTIGIACAAYGSIEVVLGRTKSSNDS